MMLSPIEGSAKSLTLPGINSSSSHNLSNKMLRSFSTSPGGVRQHERTYSLDSSAADSDGQSTSKVNGSEVGLTGRQLQQLFPYHISVDKDFNVLQLGAKLYPLVRSNLSPQSAKARVNQHISKYFKITSPASHANCWDAKMLTNIQMFSSSTTGMLELELAGRGSPLSVPAPRYGEDAVMAAAGKLVLRGRFHELYSHGLPHSAIKENDGEDGGEGSDGSDKVLPGDESAGNYLFLLHPVNEEGSYSSFAHVAAAASGPPTHTRSSSEGAGDIVAKLLAANAALVAENERLKEELNSKDMRGMIGNVAHDLKTPLAAFMGGVDLINDMAQDCMNYLALEQMHTDSSTLSQHSHTSHNSQQQNQQNQAGQGKAENPRASPVPVPVPGISPGTSQELQKKQKLISNLKTSLKSISQQAVGVRDINQFMTMTINRCIDFTKASQGVKLAPHNETVNLTEALAMPINCMIASQSKVAFRLHNPPLEICTHVITDKIWLQENMLCLMSNAAKYSNGGRVDIKISLFPAQSLAEAAVVAGAAMAAASPANGSHKNEPRAATECVVGQLSAKQVVTIHNQRTERAAAAGSAGGGSHKENRRQNRSASIGSQNQSHSRRSSGTVVVAATTKVLSPVIPYRQTIASGMESSASAEVAARAALGITVPPSISIPIPGAGAGAGADGSGPGGNFESGKPPARSPRGVSGKMESKPRANTTTDPLTMLASGSYDDYPYVSSGSGSGSATVTPKHTPAPKAPPLSPLSPLNHNTVASSPSAKHTSSGGGLLSSALGNAIGYMKGSTGKFSGSGGSPSQSRSQSHNHSRSPSQNNSQSHSRAHSSDVPSTDAVNSPGTANSKGRMNRADKLRHSMRHGEGDEDNHTVNSTIQEDIEAMALRGSFSSDGEGELDGERHSLYSDYSSRQVSTDSRQFSTDSRQYSSDSRSFRFSQKDTDLAMGNLEDEAEESAKTILSQHQMMYPSSSGSLSYSPSNYQYLMSNNLLPNTPVEVFPQHGGGLFMHRPVQQVQKRGSNTSHTSNTSYHSHHSSSSSKCDPQDSPVHPSAPAALERSSAVVSPTNLQATITPLLLIEIEDTGIGLSESNMAKLYSPFMQAQKLAGGTGLGLYSLSKRLDALGGHYGVESRKDGQPGSLFWFAIPYREDVDAANSCGKFQRSGSSRLEDLIMAAQPLLQSIVAENSAGSAGAAGIAEAAKGPIDEGTELDENPSTKVGSNKSVADPEPQAESAPHSLHSLHTSSVSSHTMSISSTRTSAGNIPPLSPSHHHGLANGQSHSPGSAIHPSAPPPHLLAGTATNPMHFLLVDDSESILKVTSMLLTRSGHTVERAENGVIALDKLAASQTPQGRPFDVVVMDLQMPVLDGLEATRRLREIEDSRAHAAETSEGKGPDHEIPRQIVIGLSANGDAETEGAAYAAGVDYFIEKPFTIQKLLDALTEIQLSPRLQPPH